MDMLRKHPGLTAVALLLLTVGFGALAGLLILDQGVFLDDPPYRDPSRLVTLTGIFTDKGGPQEWGISHIDFLDWRRQSRAFGQMAAFSPGGLDFNLVAGPQTERLSGELVSYNYFAILGGEPVLGRAFTPEEDGKPFVHPVVVISHDLWRRRFGGDRGALGRSLDLNGQKYTIVGVAPEGFHGISDKADAWIPSSMPPAEIYVANRRMRWLGGVARLKPGVTLAAAQRDMDRVTGALAAQYPDSNKGMGVRLAPVKDVWSGDLKPPLRWLTLGAALLLLLACVDVAGLLRNRPRASPPAAAPAVGPSVLLALLGAVLGLALASWAVGALVPVSGITFPSFVRLWAGPGVVAAVLALAAVCGLGIGLAAGAGGAGLGGWETAGWRLIQGAAVTAQIALAVALAAGAGLMAKGYHQAVNRDHLGFRPQNLLVVRADLQGPRYTTDPQVIAVVREYLARLSSLPGVKTLAIACPTVPTDFWVGAYVTIEDHDSDTPAGTYPIMTHSVSPDYFQALGIPIVRGRGFTMQDAGTPGDPFNVVVSKAMADQQWPGQDPIGKRLKFSTRKTKEHPWLPVVGVAADVQHEGLLADKRPAPDIYLPILISPIRIPTTLNFLAVPQPGVPAASLTPALQRGIQAVTPDTPTYDAATMEERLAKQTQKGRFQAGLAIALAALALALAVTGAAAAAGAGSRVRAVALMAAAGVALGLVGTVALGRRLGDLLHGARAGDPLILGAAALLVFLLAVAVSALAGRRASGGGISRQDPGALLPYDAAS
jgi:putative ABC transport system permease protein